MVKTLSCRDTSMLYVTIHNPDNIMPIVKKHILEPKKRILFVNNEISLTGAPKILKEIIKSTIDTNLFDCYIFSLRATNHQWDFPNSYMLDSVKGYSLEIKIKNLEKIINPDFVFANSFETYHCARYFSCNKIIFLHEYRSIINEKLDGLKNFNKIFVANEGTKKFLQSKNIFTELAPYYINFETNYANCIMGLGSCNYRKGVDRFISLAEKMPDEQFVWVGESNCVIDGYVNLIGWSNYSIDFNPEIDNPEIVRVKIKIPDNLIFVGEQPEEDLSWKWIAKAKVVLSLSYDDPFPLVIIESKARNKTVVVLKESGDVYKICDDKDLILDTYDENEIVKFINSAPDIENVSLIKSFSGNYSFFLDQIKDFVIGKEL